MAVTVNGERRLLPAQATVCDMLEYFGLDRGAVAVECNYEIVRRGEWAATVLQAGDKVEIVHFVGGG